MDKREVTQAFVKILLGAVVGSVVDKTLVTLIPVTSKFKVADMTGTFAGWWASNKFEPQLNKIVDDYYNKRESRTSK